MLREPILYPKAYTGYIALAAMDVILTALIIRLGGVEVNSVAAWVIEKARYIENTGFTGMTLFKFATVFFVLVACEFVGRQKATLGRTLATGAVALNCVPVLIAVMQLLDPSARAGM